MITKILFWASWSPKQEKEIRKVINYKYHMVLKKKTISLEEIMLFFFVHGPHVDHAVVNIHTAASLLRQG